MAMKYTLVLTICLFPGHSEGQTPTPIRLVDGNRTYGRIEVYHGGEWRSICDDCFGIPEAWAICRMLNFTNGGVPISNRWKGQNKFWIDDLRCDCDQTIDTGCAFRSWGMHDCVDTEAVGVACIDHAHIPKPTCAPPVPIGEVKCPRLATPFRPPLPNDYVGNGRIRLRGPLAYPGIGCVEYNHNGTWGSVCDDFWGTNNARVICRQLGFDPSQARAGIPAIYNYFRQNVSPYIVLDDVRCSGNEGSISNCPHSPYGLNNCTVNERLCISCQIPARTTPNVPYPDVQCDNGMISAQVSRTFHYGLTVLRLNASSGIYLSNACLDTTTSHDDNFFTINIPLDKCDTRVKTNETHIIYYNKIKYNCNGPDVITRISIKEVEVSCVFPRNLVASKAIRPLQQTMTKSAPGHYNIKMSLYLNNQFVIPVTKYPLNLTVGEWLNVALTLQAVRNDLKLVVPTCVATPSTNKYDSVNYPLFINKCERDDTLTFVPLSSMTFGFSYQTFKFCCLAANDTVYIHCDAFVCLLSEKTEQCERSCTNRSSIVSGRRRKRDNMMIKDLYHLRSPPLTLRKQNSFKYILTQQDKTASGVLKRGDKISKTTIKPDRERTRKGDSEPHNKNYYTSSRTSTTSNAETSERSHTTDVITSDQTLTFTDHRHGIVEESEFNFNEPYVAGFLCNASPVLISSLLACFLCFVVILF